MSCTTPDVLRGVNLGNWLLLEKWMAPRIFDGVAAADEHGLCECLGAAAHRHVLRHRDQFIQEEDFRWLTECGINALRIPFGHWLFDGEAPYVASPRHLDQAITWAEQYGLKVLLDLHGLPGAQGPYDHTGRSGYFRWHTDRSYINRSLDLIEQIAQRYSGRESVKAFSVINEPDPSIGSKILVPFFEEAYHRVRRHMPADEVAFVLSAYPEGELPTYHNCLPGLRNVWTDVHLYQNFGDTWDKWQLHDYLAYPLERHGRLRKHLQGGPIIVGEWSLALAPAMQKLIDALPPVRRDLIMAMHGRMLLSTFEEFTGWFFWSYRVEGQPNWSFRDVVEMGWLPRLAASTVEPLTKLNCVANV